MPSCSLGAYLWDQRAQKKAGRRIDGFYEGHSYLLFFAYDLVTPHF
jgi:hypothetical protein